ncbi:MAG: hypothetical protein JW850_17045 [Thermoflexales bacterium]|nr:hypothetical protein [Thermoflexales bacterium]
MKPLSICFAFLIFGWAVTLLATPMPAQALPYRPTSLPTPTSPPTSTPVPSPQPTALPAPSSPPEGGQIVLCVRGDVRPTVWTVVQWQDGLGDWHDVEGWRGTLDEVASGEGKKTWWVGRADLGHGLFRWLVYERLDGHLLAHSASFNLPPVPGQTALVDLTLAP